MRAFVLRFCYQDRDAAIAFTEEAIADRLESKNEAILPGEPVRAAQLERGFRGRARREHLVHSVKMSVNISDNVYWLFTGGRLWVAYAKELLEMAPEIFIAFTGAAITTGLLSANTPVAFKVNEPVSVAGLPPVTLGPGSYVIRNLGSSAGANVVQILSQRQDYVYTTVLTIPVVRPYPEDNHQMVFSETASGNPPALHYWFPPGETLGHEFIQPRIQLTPEWRTVPNQLQLRIDAMQNGAAPFEGSPADFYALREALLRIESGKLARARDCFRRNYFLAQNREGTFTSFLLALLMTDVQVARFG